MVDNFDKALKLHQKGKLAAAETLYRKVLRSMPGHADALHLLGVIAAQKGDFQGSVGLIGQAIGIAPGNAVFHSNLGNALRALGQPEAAVREYDRAVALAPGHAEAHYNRAVALQALGRPEEAVAGYDRAIALRPDYAEAYSNRGAALRDLGRLGAALASYDRAIAIRPNHAVAHSNRANTLRELGRVEEAVAGYDRAIALRPDYAEAWLNRGIALQQSGYPEAALASFDRAIAIGPNLAQAHCCRGNALMDLLRPAEALDCYDRAIALRPDYAEAHSNRGNALYELREFEAALAAQDRAIGVDPGYAEAYSNRGRALQALEGPGAALESYDAAIARKPDFVDACWNKALALLAVGDFGAGWELFESRWRKPSFTSKPHPTGRPGWNGTDTDVRLMVWPEQGVGDQILFGTILGDLAGVVPKVTVLTDDRLVPLYRRSIPAVDFVPVSAGIAEDAYDAHLPIGSLARLFRGTAADFGRAAGARLRADESRARGIRASVGQRTRPLIGLSWHSKNARAGASKSIGLPDFLPLFANTDADFVNLQYGDTREEIEALKSQHGVDLLACDSVDNFSDLDGLAALIDACDMVVTTSNTTAHLAGALGKETLLLIPNSGDRLWYWWNEQGGRSLWYPSVRIYARRAPAGLDDVMAEMARDIRQRPVGRPSGP